MEGPNGGPENDKSTEESCKPPNGAENSDSFSEVSDKSSSSKVPEEIIKARDDWKQIEAQQNQLNQLPKTIGVGGVVIDRTSHITFYDSRMDLTSEARNINCSVPPLSLNSGFFSCCSPSPSAASTLLWSDIYKLTKLQFDESNVTHHRVLNTIHYHLTGISSPPRFGANWQTIGFQSNNPIQDLRSMGLFALLLPLGLFSNFKSLSKRLIDTSRLPGQDFPIMLILIVYVKEIYDACATTDLITHGVNSLDEGWQRILNFYAGIVDITCREWTNGGLSMGEDFKAFEMIPLRAKSRVEATIAAGKKTLDDEKVVAEDLSKETILIAKDE